MAARQPKSADRTSILYAEILRKIMDGYFRPGERLKEEQLAASFRVSRTPVREVLFALEKDGVVERTRQRGARVATFTSEDVEELFEIRKALECSSVSSAVRNLRLSALLELQDQIQELLHTSGSRMHEKHWVLDSRLHEMIVNASGNKRLVAYLNGLNRLRRSLALLAFLDDHHARQAGERHLAIVKALIHRDAEEAKQLLAEDITKGCHEAIELFHRQQKIQRKARSSSLELSPQL